MTETALPEKMPGGAFLRLFENHAERQVPCER